MTYRIIIFQKINKVFKPILVSALTSHFYITTFKKPPTSYMNITQEKLNKPMFCVLEVCFIYLYMLVYLLGKSS